MSDEPIDEPQAVVEEPPVVPSPLTNDKVITIMETWWQDTMPGSPLGRVTEAYNHVVTEFENLKNLIRRA